MQGWSTDKSRTVITWASLGSPPELYVLSPHKDAKPQPITAVNAQFLKEKRFADFEQFSFKGWNDETVYGYVVKPIGLTTGQTYPVVFIVHDCLHIKKLEPGPRRINTVPGRELIFPE